MKTTTELVDAILAIDGVTDVQVSDEAMEVAFASGRLVMASDGNDQIPAPGQAWRSVSVFSADETAYDESEAFGLGSVALSDAEFLLAIAKIAKAS